MYSTMEGMESNDERCRIVLSEDVICLLQEKDKMLSSMAKKVNNLEKQTVKLKDRDNLKSKRIAKLEYENEKLLKDRDSLSTKLTLLAYKLQLSTPKYNRTTRTARFAFI